MGGHVALHLAMRRPEQVDRLILALANSTGIRRDFSPRELAILGRGLLPPRAWGAPHFIPTMAADAWHTGPREVYAALQAVLRDDVGPMLPRLRRPTLVLWGALDPFVPLGYGRAMADAIPRGRLIVLEGADHNPMVDRPRLFDDAVLDFLSE